MHITLVKKIKQNGQACAKSARVLNELEELELLAQIDRIVAADEREVMTSEGYALAAEHGIEAAPFFIVTNDDGSTRTFTAYHRFLKEIFNREVSEEDTVNEILAQNPDLDFI